MLMRVRLQRNESKLTQIALSVRFGATLAHLHQADLKLLAFAVSPGNVDDEQPLPGRILLD